MQTLARDKYSHAFLAGVTKAVGSKWISLLQMPPMRTWILDVRIGVVQLDLLEWMIG